MLSDFIDFRDVAQPGSALAWGASGRWFESSRPDQFFRKIFFRAVAQPGSALRSGRRGRWFESSLPDSSSDIIRAFFMNYFVYILYSESFDRFYIGQTKNVVIRLERHNSGREKSTAPYMPWLLVWFCEKPNRMEAMKLEKKLKNLSKARIWDFIKKYSK